METKHEVAESESFHAAAATLGNANMDGYPLNFETPICTGPSSKAFTRLSLVR